MRSTFIALASAATVSASALVPRQSGSPCAQVSASSSSYLAANPTATVAIVDGPTVYACLESIPINQQNALDLVKSLQPYVELQSTLAYLKDPPSGYLYPKIDLRQGLNDIAAGVANGKYAGEYDFQTDLQALFIAARDRNLNYQPDLAGIASFKVPNTPLGSYSDDGVSIPPIYATSDLLALGQFGIGFRNTSIGVPYIVSPITSINGVDVFTYLSSRAAEFPLLDPDAAWNYLFSTTVQIAQFGVFGDGGFPNPTFYPGPETILGFANGTSRPIPTGSEIYADFNGVTDGPSAYAKFCGKTNFTNPAPPNITQTPSPVVPFYPFPVIKSSQNQVAGYFLNDTTNTDVAVLSILSFDAPTNAAEFQSDVSQFLTACASNNKTKLVIDLSGNGGGIVDLALSTFTQLFPNIYPHSQSNMRASDVLNSLGQAASSSSSSSGSSPLNSASDVKPNTSTPYSSWSDVYGPVQSHGDNFTNLFEENLTAAKIATNSTAAPPFSSDKIIIITDGFCSSACAVFVELSKSLASVHTVVIGGRPQPGPMQSVGGTKGRAAFTFESLSAISSSALNATALDRAFNPELPSVNLENNIRVGDGSATPLQFVYEAADCRFFFTHDMLISQVPVWQRAANVSFNGDSAGCVPGSTGHASSLSGGAGNATGLGLNSTVPASAKNGTDTGMWVSSNGTVGGNSSDGWGGKAWGVGGWNLGGGNATSNASSTTTTGSPTASKTGAVASSTKSGGATREGVGAFVIGVGAVVAGLMVL